MSPDINGTSPLPSSPVARSGITVIIIGAGFAGLTAAIECHRKGHTPIVLESFAELKINSYLGEYLFYQNWDTERSYGTAFNGHRGEIHKIVYDHALSLGIEIRLGQNITEYFEAGTEAGVVSNGHRIVGDTVLAADGVRSKGRRLVLGYEDKPKSSGYAIYRAWFDSGEIARNPLTKHLVENGDTHTAWLGPDIHFLAASIKDGKDFSWVCTHKDDADVEEGWQQPGTREDALRVLDGWSPVVHEIVKATPFLVDWKLVYRDPLPTWISPQGRIALIGDAAHPFLPTSVQGASQAMEDGATVAVCLALGGAHHVPEALRAFEKIRYGRVRAAQKTGESTRDKWHKADFDRVKENPESLRMVREAWLLNHDAEMHAYEIYAETIASMSCNTRSAGGPDGEA